MSPKKVLLKSKIETNKFNSEKKFQIASLLCKPCIIVKHKSYKPLYESI